jgi:lipoate-protein ligase A
MHRRDARAPRPLTRVHIPDGMHWHLILDPDGHPGAHNMAVDESLLFAAARSGCAFLRLYRFSPPCLSFGRNEPALARYDRAAIERLGCDVVRRPTGGRAVWHDAEVTYAVAAPIAAFGTLRDSYHAIHARLAAALRSLGVPALLAEPRRGPGVGDGPCFATPVGGEVVAGGKKLIGSAQVRRGDAFLQHGSILLDGSQDVIQAVSRQPSAVSATSLSAVLGRPVGYAEVAEAIITAWDTTFTNLHHPPPSSTSFASLAWTWRR